MIFGMVIVTIIIVTFILAYQINENVLKVQRELKDIKKMLDAIKAKDGNKDDGEKLSDSISDNLQGQNASNEP